MVPAKPDDPSPGVSQGSGIPPAPAEFQGTWVGTCDPSYDFSTKKDAHSQWQYVISGSEVLWKISTFSESDKDCSVPLNVITYVMTGRFGEESLTEVGAREVDLIFHRLDYRIDDDEGIVAANARQEYGFSDWQKSVTKDISNAPGISNWPVVYTLFKVDEQGLHLAKLTSERNGSAPDKRPTQVGTSTYKRRL